MFRTTLLAAALFATGSAHALSAGDLAFTSFNADDDSWALVAFTDIAANTTIHFSDNEWTGSAFADLNEHALTWNTGAGTITAGTVVTFVEIDAATDVISASVGTLSLAVGGGANLGLSKSNETFYAYLGSASSATTFLTAITTEQDAAPSNVTSAGLTFGVNAIALMPDADFGEYIGVRSDLPTLVSYAPLVFDGANWEQAGSGEFTGRVLDATAFTAAVPEPTSYAMLLAGLGMLGMVVRRRIG